MKKRHFVLLTMVLLFSLCAITSACNNPSTDAFSLDDISQTIQEKILLSSQVVEVDDVEVELALYNDNGVLVRTASVVDEDQKSDLDFAQLETVIAAQNILDYQRLQNTQYRALAATQPFYSNFSNYTTNSRNSNCNVGHSGKWYGGQVGGRYAAEADSLQIGAVYSGSGNAELIVLSQSITCTSSALSFSVPVGFSWSQGSTTASWSSAPYTNVSLAEAYIDGSAHTTGILEAGFTVSSTSEIRTNPSTSYVTGTQSSYYNH